MCVCIYFEVAWTHFYIFILCYYNCSNGNLVFHIGNFSFSCNKFGIYRILVIIIYYLYYNSAQEEGPIVIDTIQTLKKRQSCPIVYNLNKQDRQIVGEEMGTGS